MHLRQTCFKTRIWDVGLEFRDIILNRVYIISGLVYTYSKLNLEARIPEWRAAGLRDAVIVSSPSGYIRRSYLKQKKKVSKWPARVH